MRRPVVLNTRPSAQAADLSHLLRERGFSVVEAPAIEIVPAFDPAELTRVAAALTSNTYDWIVVASPNAGRDLLVSLQHAAERVVCGTSTAAALGLPRVGISLPRFSASAALEALRPMLHEGQRVLVPRAAEGRDELVDGLRTLRVSVDAPVAYRTQAVEAARRRLAVGDIEVVVACSPSAIASVAPGLESDVRVVCLGQTTAQAAASFGLRVDAIAANTSMAALVGAVESVSGVRA